MGNEITNIVKLSSAKAALAAKRQAVLNVRTAIVYALLCIAISAVISYVFSIIFAPNHTSLASKLIPASSFTLLGILFAAFLYTKLRFLTKPDYTNGVVYSLGVFTCVFLAVLTANFIKGDHSVITCLYYSSLFLLPFAIYQTWLFYKRLSLTSYSKLWYFPEHSSQMPKATVFLNSVQIKIKMAPVYGASERIYETTVPGRISVGTMFNDFVNEKNSTEDSEFGDMNNQLFGWQFFAPSLMGLGVRKIDADLSLDQNKIKNNTLIIARRMPI